VALGAAPEIRRLVVSRWRSKHGMTPLRQGVVRPALTRFCLMLNELGGAVGGGGSARNAEVEFGPYTSVLSKATALDVAKLAGVASATRPRRLQLPAVRLQQQ
jgi:hypothetical protein